MTDKIIGHILLETNFDNGQAIRSAEYVGGRKDKVKMEVILQDTEVVNRNNRLYHKKDLQDALNSEYIREKLATNSLLGEFNHPPFDANNIARQSLIDLNNVSHVIKEIYWSKTEPNVLLGIVETAGTRVGRDLAGLIMENNMICSFSMRGTGTVVDKGKYREVVGPVGIKTWDCVQFPSHKRAYMTKALNEENTQFAIKESAIIREIAKLSENSQTVLTEFVQTTENLVNYDYSNGGIIIRSKDDNKALGYAYLEESLKREYADFMRSL